MMNLIFLILFALIPKFVEVSALYWVVFGIGVLGYACKLMFSIATEEL